MTPSPHADHFNDEEHEVYIPFDEWGEVRFPGVPDEPQEEERESMMQVTREMAIDAGDRRLEGTWVNW